MKASRRGVLSVAFLPVVVPFLAFPAFGQGAEPNDVETAVRTSRYVFLSEQSTIVQTGGIAGVNWTYAVEGQFCLSVDPNTGAWFSQVYANAVDVSEPMRTLDPNQVFNLAGLGGTVLDEATIAFTGQVADGSSVHLTLTFEDDVVYLAGETIPPPNSADFFVFTIDAVATRKYAGGTGEPNDPYIIAAAADLIALGETPDDYDKHFILTADIDLSGFVYGRALIAPDTDTEYGYQGTAFTGVFDGNGHAIANFRVSSSADCVGLFGHVMAPDAEIKNLGLLDPNIAASAGWGTGSLVGQLTMGSVQNCFVDGGTVSGYDSLGGLVGEAGYGTIMNCYASTSVSGQSGVGGLVGDNRADLRDCHATGDAVGVLHTGGLVGVHSTHHARSRAGEIIFFRGTITSCHATGGVTGEICVGGLVGRTEGGPVADSFATGRVSGNNSVGGLTGLNVGDLKDCYATGSVMGGYYAGGLVGTNWETIRGCYATGSVTGSDSVGGLVGENEGTITSSSSMADVTGVYRSGGGFVGRNYGQVTACSSDGTVSGYGDVGGLAGSNWGSIVASFSTGDASDAATDDGGHAADGVKGPSIRPPVSRVGGLVGNNWGRIAMSYSAGRVTGARAGGLVGYGAYPVTVGFWDVETSGRATSGGGVGLTTAQMQDMAIFLSEGWDFVDESLNGTCDYWQMSPGDYPRLRCLTGDRPQLPEGLGTPETPYLIRDAGDLGTVWFEPLAHYRLDASIDLADVTWCVAPIPWFGGSFEGNGYVISRLHIQGSANLGLFGRLGSEAEVSYLGLEAVDVNGDRIFAGAYVGGLAGSSLGRITMSYSTGRVSGGGAVGGLVGSNDGTGVEYCYSTAAVSGGVSVGGLLGSNTGRARNCYATGSVTGVTYVGGLIGENGDSSSEGGSAVYSHVRNCYSTGPLWGDRYVGGLIGICWEGCGSGGCFWDTESSLLATSSGKETGLTTVKMQTAATFLDAGWDFVGEVENGTEDIWWIDEGQDYPRLWWEAAPETMH